MNLNNQLENEPLMNEVFVSVCLSALNAQWMIFGGRKTFFWFELLDEWNIKCGSGCIQETSLIFFFIYHNY